MCQGLTWTQQPEWLSRPESDHVLSSKPSKDSNHVEEEKLTHSSQPKKRLMIWPLVTSLTSPFLAPLLQITFQRHRLLSSKLAQNLACSALCLEPSLSDTSMHSLRFLSSSVTISPLQEAFPDYPFLKLPCWGARVTQSVKCLTRDFGSGL